MTGKPFGLSVSLMSCSEEGGMAGRGWEMWHGASRGSALVFCPAAGSSWGPSYWNPWSGDHGPLGNSRDSQPPRGPIPASSIKQIRQKGAAKDQDDEAATDDDKQDPCRKGRSLGSSPRGLRPLHPGPPPGHRRFRRRLLSRHSGRGGGSSGGAGFPRGGVEVGRVWGRHWRQEQVLLNKVFGSGRGRVLSHGSKHARVPQKRHYLRLVSSSWELCDLGWNELKNIEAYNLLIASPCSQDEGSSNLAWAHTSKHLVCWAFCPSSTSFEFSLLHPERAPLICSVRSSPCIPLLLSPLTASELILILQLQLNRHFCGEAFLGQLYNMLSQVLFLHRIFPFSITHFFSVTIWLTFALPPKM